MKKQRTETSKEQDDAAAAARPALTPTLHPSLHHPAARAWSEPSLEGKKLMYPLFVREAEEDKLVKGFEPNKQWGCKNGFETMLDQLATLHNDMGLTSCMLFGVVSDKDETGTKADSSNTPVIMALLAIRKRLPNMFVAVDVCLCEYTSHGHCGLLKEHSLDGCEVIDNSATNTRLATVAVQYAKAGAHMVCPSDMMDGRIASIKQALEDKGFNHVMIMAYTSKKASSFYAPFRQAVDSTFTGNRKRYQHPVGSTSHASRAYERDVSQGADVVIVKPALFYGDIISSFAQKGDVPVAAYIVSGEYVMLKAYGEQTGDLNAVIEESHLSLVRAGASILITYFAPEILQLLKSRQS
jgi:porphobilinogen synthase